MLKVIKETLRLKPESLSEDKRDVFLNLNQHCQAKLLNCTLISTDVHHLYSGKDRNKYYLDETTWKAVCRNCHNYIHDKLSKEDAINLNLKLIE